ncbi:hypothetical protein [Herbiconiux flava]|uniref:Uncharacterized protein n=1 Tax=Herbiconiux flava TaxID=881268 RepID=A0A852SP63_9MICO|nr:hypothetical protein [Herbiconiux flava]NYD70609.1 hypothetical protein [Herbiconiux flava]
MNGLGWKATAAVAVVFFVVAGASVPVLFGGGDVALWRWLFPVAWLALGIAQLVRARKKYVAEKQVADGAADSSIGATDSGSVDHER